MILYQHFFFTAKIMENRNKTIVVKFGTSTLTQGSPKLNRPHMIDIVRQLAQLHQAGFRYCIETVTRRCGAKSVNSNLGTAICDL